MSFLSDEEKKKKSTLESYFKTPSPHKTKQKPEVKKEDSEVKKTPISAMDFFGGGSVKRKERPIVSSKRKLVCFFCIFCSDSLFIFSSLDYYKSGTSLHLENLSEKVKLENEVETRNLLLGGVEIE